MVSPKFTLSRYLVANKTIGGIKLAATKAASNFYGNDDRG